MVGAANDLNISQAGYVVFDGISDFSGRTFQEGTGIKITNPDGVIGNSTISLDGSVAGQTITGNTGGALSPTLGNWNIITDNANVGFSGSSSTLKLDFANTNNLLLGSSGSITTGQFNIGIGQGSQALNQSGSANISIGYDSLSSNVLSSSNVAIGHRSLASCTSSLNTGVGIGSLSLCSTGTGHTALGYDAGATITGGNRCIFIGYLCGSSYQGNESYNILINNSGVLGESNTIRIGRQGSFSDQQNRCFIAGINGVTVSNAVPVTIDSTTGQLGVGTAVTQGIVTINGDSGSITGSTVTLYSNQIGLGCGSSVSFTNSGTVSTLQLSDSLNNMALGSGAGNLFISGANNSGQGVLTLANLTSGDSNCCLGSTSLTNLTTGSNNVAMGVIALQNLVSGDNNIGIGRAAGQAYTTNESNNICIGASVAGTIGESNTTRIGNGSTKCIIAGIRGITTVNNDAIAVLIDSSGQLGTISSSIRYKENVEDLQETNVLKLRPVSFNFKNDHRKSTGLIAEEVEQIMPELVAYNTIGICESVKYHDLPVLLLKEIQKLVERIEQLESKIE